MIADKLYPSFYLLELEGKAITAIIPGDFGINKIAVGSIDFPSDMMAIGGLTDAMRFVTGSLEAANTVEEVSFNPEFFPTLAPLELTEAQQEAIMENEEAAEDLQEELEDTDKVVVPLTNSFDSIGDFVETRWIVTAEGFRVEGRVAVQPQYYLIEKRNAMNGHADQISIH